MPCVRYTCPIDWNATPRSSTIHLYGPATDGLGPTRPGPAGRVGPSEQATACPVKTTFWFRWKHGVGEERAGGAGQRCLRTNRRVSELASMSSVTWRERRGRSAHARRRLRNNRSLSSQWRHRAQCFKCCRRLWRKVESFIRWSTGTYRRERERKKGGDKRGSKRIGIRGEKLSSVTENSRWFSTHDVTTRHDGCLRNNLLLTAVQNIRLTFYLRAWTDYLHTRTMLVLFLFTR